MMREASLSIHSALFTEPFHNTYCFLLTQRKGWEAFLGKQNYFSGRVLLGRKGEVFTFTGKEKKKEEKRKQ